MYVVLSGYVTEGIVVTGPFDSFQEASAWAETGDGFAEIVKVQKPE